MLFRIGSLFFLNAVMLGSFLSRLPDVLIRLEIDKATLGMALFAAPVGSILAAPFAGGIIERFTPGRTAVVAGLLLAPAMAAVAAVGDVVVMAGLLLLAGAINGFMEVAVNASADQAEKRTGAKIMSRCHGFWSLGFMAGALVAGVAAEQQVSYTIHLAAVSAVGALAALVLGRMLPSVVKTRPLVDPAAEKPPTFALPNRLTIGICLMAVGVTLAEGAIYDWGTLYLREDVGASPFWASFAYAGFTFAMAVGRLGGDMVRQRVGAATIIRVCSLMAGLGFVGFILAPSVTVAAASLALAGLGISLVFPVAVSAVAARGGPSAAANMAGLSLSVMTALLLSPPLVGIIGEGFGLATAFALLLPLIALTGLLAGQAEPRGPKPVPLPTAAPAA